MKMFKFRVQNYKKVQDTGWVSCGKITAFVGKNEAGKSAIFRGLSKLNPSDQQKYDSLKEFPRRRYTTEYKQQEEWPVASAEFALDANEKTELSRIATSFKKIKSVVVSRSYSGKLEISFLPCPSIPDTSVKAFGELLDICMKNVQDLSAPEGKGELFGKTKPQLIKFIQEKIDLLVKTKSSPIMDVQQVNDLMNKLSGLSNEDWQKELLKNCIGELRNFVEKTKIRSSLRDAEKWVEQHLPKFIYFDNYDAIVSAVHISTFITQISQNPNAPGVRTTKCLFQHVGLDLADIQKLDPTPHTQPGQPNNVSSGQRLADERAIKMSSASNAMTKKFSDWWEQRKHQFKYQIDGQFFRVWVCDDLDPSEVELDQRSSGLQYFFSFYLVFLVEAEGEHKNSILLLDEPGLHFHGTQQEKMVKFLNKISQENQVLYSTHSPFMIDGNHLEHVRVVYEDIADGSTKVSQDIWPRDKDALFPLQAALGYSIAQTLFYSNKQVAVEGLTDYWFFKIINLLLSQKGMMRLRDDIVVIPTGGVNKLATLAAVLTAHQVKIVIVLDGDIAARKAGKDLQNTLLVKEKNRCIFLDDYFCKPGLEIEDTFPEELYLKAVKVAYPGLEIKFTEKEEQQNNITKKLEAAFKRLGHEGFENWKPARVILDWIEKDPDILPNDVLQNFEKLFIKINELL